MLALLSTLSGIIQPSHLPAPIEGDKGEIQSQRRAEAEQTPRVSSFPLLFWKIVYVRLKRGDEHQNVGKSLQTDKVREQMSKSSSTFSAGTSITLNSE